MTDAKQFKFGRRPRIHDSRVPHRSMLTMGVPMAAPPPYLMSYANMLPANLGEMMNDRLGCCTCAAVGHAIQLWSEVADHSMITPPDSAILSLYEAVGGYVPGKPETDGGAIEQEVLAYWLNNPVDGNKLIAYVEIDPANMDDVKRTIVECGLAYIGFNVPAYLQQGLMTAGSIWDVNQAADNSSIGGHAVIIDGYDDKGNLSVISWGSQYSMTPAFWDKQVDECYGLVNDLWVQTTGSTPAGLPLEALESLMQSLKYSPKSAL